MEEDLSQLSFLLEKCKLNEYVNEYNRVSKLFLDLCFNLDKKLEIKSDKNNLIGLSLNGIEIKNFSHFNNGVEFLKKDPSKDEIIKEMNKIINYKDK